MAKSSNPEGKTGVRIVVAGDRGTGKSSLIVTAAADTFAANVPRLLPPTRLPEDFYPDRVPITIIDTSSNFSCNLANTKFNAIKKQNVISPEDRGKLAEELKRADAVVLTYACDQPETLNRLSTFWLPELRQLEVKVPVIVVGCRLDLRDELQQVSLEQVMSPIMQQFREIETCIECSAYKHIQIPEVFYYAQKAVLHPTGPLFDQESQTLKPRCVRALKRIFILCDHDRDGALSDAELNDFQVKCFNAPLQPSEIVGVKRVVQDKLVEGVNERGLTLTGFLFLHALFIEKGRLETTWTVLRKFGYNNDIKLSDDLIPHSSFKRAPDQSVELTNEAIEFLKGIYELFDSDLDDNLRPIEVEDVFSTAPESPWNDAPYKDAAEKTALGGLSLDAFLSEWALMTLLDPARSVENLIYIGYPGDASSAIRVTRRRRLDRKKQQSERNVFQCFLFGPTNAGKSALMNSFLGRPYSDSYSPTTDERYAVNVVELPGGIKKTLVLREIPEDGVRKLLSTKDSLAACDIAVFVHDSSDESSWKRATELLVDVAGHGEDTGYEVPCLIVAAKDDLDSFPMAIQDSTRVSQDMGIDAPIPISSKLGDFNNIFRTIVNAAEHPHLSIPETEAGRSRKQYHRLINRSLMFVSVGAAVAIVGLAAYRVYAARKSASS
ncbi:mitochondrial Rho GTPase 1-like isoform X1 [Herrania umbratica]|uniref:Mitochondrial Rho GTPase n=1 Tax=Herrania umbratica TaxID=108875 RepID=A0A6J1A618_9ROSI|nr:mitochondrial Rho GTPase 1-like isoform X1 [Herrania umbratica]